MLSISFVAFVFLGFSLQRLIRIFCCCFFLGHRSCILIFLFDVFRKKLGDLLVVFFSWLVHNVDVGGYKVVYS